MPWRGKNFGTRFVAEALVQRVELAVGHRIRAQLEDTVALREGYGLAGHDAAHGKAGQERRGQPDGRQNPLRHRHSLLGGPQGAACF
jgi:hypothetical protein